MKTTYCPPQGAEKEVREGVALVVYKAIGTTSSGIQYAAAGSIVLIIPALVFTFIIRKYIGQMWGGVEL